MNSDNFRFSLFLMLIVGCFVGLIAFGYQINSSYEQRFNTWSSQCRQRKGEVQIFSQTFNGDRYECFINGKLTTLPGWEGY